METESDPWTLACLHRLETVSRSDSHTRAALPAQRQQALLPSWLCPPTSPASSPSRQRTPHLRALLRQRRGHRARVPAPASLRCCRDPRARGTRPPAGYSSHPSQVRWGQADSGQTLAPPRPCSHRMGQLTSSLRGTSGMAEGPKAERAGRGPGCPPLPQRLPDGSRV